jgi:signal transduction histidine kinase
VSAWSAKMKLTGKDLTHTQKGASLGILLSGIAHELGNLNNCITFNIPILRDYIKELIPIIDVYARNHKEFEVFGMSYPEFRKDVFQILDNIEHASSRITETGSGLKEFARVASTEKQRWVEVSSVIMKSVALCQKQIRKTVKSFEVNIAEDVPLIFTDPVALEQVLVNLLINAAQAVDGGNSRVMINARQENTWQYRLIIEVSDNGCGMDEKTREMIFEPFFTTRVCDNGSGLGLFVSKNLIEKMGGRIEVESKFGVGSTFRIVLQKRTSGHVNIHNQQCYDE